jgi:hypothetical protein
MRATGLTTLLTRQLTGYPSIIMGEKKGMIHIADEERPPKSGLPDFGRLERIPFISNHRSTRGGRACPGHPDYLAQCFHKRGSRDKPGDDALLCVDSK